MVLGIWKREQNEEIPELGDQSDVEGKSTKILKFPFGKLEQSGR